MFKLLFEIISDADRFIFLAGDYVKSLWFWMAITTVDYQCLYYSIC